LWRRQRIERVVIVFQVISRQDASRGGSHALIVKEVAGC
jgi:hypothetical protein